jgi:succinate-semialdehyde dehydrogenase/glutarate-semialdehyde dehydrogenase
VSPTRFNVQEGIYGAFTDSFAKAAKSLRLGNGMDPDTQMGPVANPRRRDAMDRFVADAKQRGGRVIAGGERMGNRGYFYQPTAIADLPDDALAMREEPFGPLALIVPFKTPEEAIQRANSLEFGLASYAFTTSEKRAAAVSAGLKSGMVGVNSFLISFPETPFGGVKESGFGQEGGSEGLESYLDRKLIHMA